MSKENPPKKILSSPITVKNVTPKHTMEKPQSKKLLEDWRYSWIFDFTGHFNKQSQLKKGTVENDSLK